MTMLDVAFAMPIVLIGIAMLLGTMTAASRQQELNQQRAVVAETARALLEELRNESMQDLFALYNQDPFDDPNGPGTAPGNRFTVDGVEPPANAPGTPEGEILLPAFDAGIAGVPDWELREDVDMPELGMPRDLTRDNVIDGRDHAGDVAVLPVLVRIRWQGILGPQQYELQTLLTEYIR